MKFIERAAFRSSFIRFVDLQFETAKVELDNAILEGNDIEIKAITDTTTIYDADPKGRPEGFLGLIESLIDFADFKVLAGVAVSTATSEIIIGEHTAIAGADVTIDASATSKAEVEVVTIFYGVAVGVSIPTASVVIEDSVTIDTTDDLTISATAKSGINVLVQHSANLDFVFDPSVDTFLGQLFGPDFDDLDPQLLDFIDTGEIGFTVSTSRLVEKWQVVNFALAIGVSIPHASVNIASLAVINVGNDFSLTSEIIKDQKVKAAAVTFSTGIASVGTGFSLFTGTATTIVDGKVTAEKDIVISAKSTTKKDDLSSASKVGGLIKDISINTGGDFKFGKSIDKLIIVVREKLIKRKNEKNADALKEAAKDDKTQATDIAFAPVLSIAVHVSITDAHIGAGAEVVSKFGIVTVESINLLTPKITAAAVLKSAKEKDVDAGTKKRNELKENSLGGAILAGIYVNVTDAHIGQNAQVDAGGRITVKTDSGFPWEYKGLGRSIYDGFFGPEKNTVFESVTGTVSEVDTIISKYDKDYGIKGTLFNSLAESKIDGKELALSGTINVMTLVSISHAYIDQDAKINQNSLRTGSQEVVVEALSNISTVNLSGTASLNEKDLITINLLKIKETFDKTDVSFGAKAAKSAGGSLIIGININVVKAEIKEGVVLFADSLLVDAVTKNINVSLAVAGSKASEFGFAGSGNLMVVVNNTQAIIDGDAVITTGSRLIENTEDTVLVNADDFTLVVSAAGSIAKGGDVGIGLSAAVNVVVRKTEAILGNTDGVAPTGKVSSQGNVTLDAKNYGGIVSITTAGAIQKGEAPKSDSTESKDKYVKVGLFDPPSKIFEEFDIPTGSSLSGSEMDWTAINKKINEGKGANDNKDNNKTGVAVSGAASVNVIVDTTRSLLQNAHIVQVADLNVRATNSTGVVAVAGSLSLSGGSSKKTIAAGGAATINVLISQTESFIDKTTIDQAGDLNLKAQTYGGVLAVVASLGVGAGKEGAGVSGAASINLLVQTTRAHIENSRLTAVDDITLYALNGTGIITFAGAVGSGASAGVGASIVINTLIDSTHAFISDTQIIDAENISITAIDGSLVVGIAVAGGFSKGGMSVPISFLVNTVVTDTKAYIDTTDGATTINATGDIAMLAVEGTGVLGVAGSLGITGGGGGDGSDGGGAKGSAGAAIVINTYVGSTGSYIDGQYIDFDPESSAVINQNEIDFGANHNLQTGDAVVYDSKGETAGVVELTSGVVYYVIRISDTRFKLASTRDDAQNQVAISINTAPTNATTKKHQFKKLVIKAAKNLNMTTVNGAVVVSIAAAGQGGEKFAVGGSIAVNTVVKNTGTYIKDAFVNVDNDTTMTMVDGSVIAALAGSVQIVTKDEGAAVGVAIAVNTLVSNTHSYLDNVIMGSGAADNLNMRTVNGSIVVSLAVSGQFGGKFAIGGSIAVNTIVTKTQSYIKDSTVYVSDTITMITVDGLIIASGAGSLQIGKGAASIGAAIAVNTRVVDTQTYVEGSMLNSESAIGNHLTMTSINGSIVGNLAVSGQGADKFAMGGSIVVNTLVSNTQTFMKNTKGFFAGDTSLLSVGGSVFGAISGSVQIATGGAAIGASIAVNTLVNKVDSYLDAVTLNSQAKPGGDVFLDAFNVSVITALAFSGQGASKFALGGSLAVNTIVNTTQAIIRNNSFVYVAADKDVSLSAHDISVNAVFSGSVQIAASGGAVGAAISVNTIANTVNAIIDNSTLNAGGQVNLTAESVAVVGSLAIGGQGAAKFAVGGSITVNTVAQKINAKIVNSAIVKTVGDVVMTARDVSVIGNIAGSGQIAPGGAAVGAAISVNTISNNVNSNIDNSTVNAQAATSETFEFDLSQTTVNDMSNTIDFGVIHSFETGDAVVFTQGADAYDNINHDRTYYVIEVSDSTIKIADSKEKANSGVEIDISNLVLEYKLEFVGNLLLDDSNPINNNTLYFQTQHFLQTGDTIVYYSGGNSPIKGLIHGQKYYVIHVGDQAVKLATSASNASNSIAVNIEQTASSGEHRFEKTLSLSFNPATAVSNNDDTITFATTHGLETGSTIEYHSNDYGHLPGLTDGQTYFVIKVDEYTIKLAKTANQATTENSSAVDLEYVLNALGDKLKIRSGGGSVRLSAANVSVVANFSAGGQIASYAAVGGSLSVNNIANTTKTFINNTATVTATNDIDLSAADTSVIGNIAGSGQGAKYAAFGAAIAVNKLGNTIAAYVDNSTLVAGHDVVLEAANTSVVGSVAVSGQLSIFASFGGSFAVNTLVTNTRAYVSGDSSVNASNDIVIRANNTSVNAAFTGSA